MEINDKIKSKRLESGQTLQEVAQKVGVTKATVQRWESGLIANMRRDKIALLAKALNTTPSYILGIGDYNVNNSIIGNNNNNNRISGGRTLTPVQDAILTICSTLPEKEQGEVLAYATKLLSESKERK